MLFEYVANGINYSEKMVLTSVFLVFYIPDSSRIHWRCCVIHEKH